MLHVHLNVELTEPEDPLPDLEPESLPVTTHTPALTDLCAEGSCSLAPRIQTPRCDRRLAVFTATSSPLQ